MIVDHFTIISPFPWTLSIICLIFGGMCFTESVKKESFGKFMVSVISIGCGIFYSILALQKQTSNIQIETSNYIVKHLEPNKVGSDTLILIINYE